MVVVPEITIVRQIEIPEASIKLRSDGIIMVNYKKNITLDVDLQVRMREIYLKLTNNKKSMFVFQADEGFALTKEARENSEKLAGSSPILAYAIIVNNPKVAFKLFPNVDDAIKWLHTLKT
jgi:hypothetical protein